MISVSSIAWVGFIVLVLGMLLVDLGVFHRRPHAISIPEALAWSVGWIGVGLLFNLGIYYAYDHHWFGLGLNGIGGQQAGLEFLTAFVLEKSLSLDNLFVMALIFTYFGVAARYQHRVLFWGILGVLVLRGTMIAAGVALLSVFTWVSYVFGVLLIVSAIKMLRGGGEQPDPATNPLVRFVARLVPVSRDYDGGRFFTKRDGVPAITPLLVVLLVVESTDVMFALDSIPAVLGVSRDTFLIFTSNVFAVLGLRSLYFVLAGILHRFQHLRTSLFLVLMYVGVKMLLVHYYQVDVVVSLFVILGILAVGLTASQGSGFRVQGSGDQDSELQDTASPPGTAKSAAPAYGQAIRPLAHATQTQDSGDLAIRAVQVTKFYGRRCGISDLSLAIPRGATVGLLGPNGAGKTTAIRILSCHMPPTSGSVQVCGFDVFSQSVEVRRRLGYLPENCPLYPEMRVIEYLRWTAEMKGTLGSEIDRAVFHILDACHVDHVRRQSIGTLSKGYRQRVGLAAALIHQPEVVILDEPTIGLDPLQAREFRNLIGTLKGQHTVLISSHILSEIDVLCDSVVILNEGSVVASGSPQELRQHVAPRYTVECRSDPALKVLLPRLVHGVGGVALEHYEENGEFVSFQLSGDGEDPRVEIFRVFAAAGIELREMSRQRVTLEDVFLHYTRAHAESSGIPKDGPLPADRSAFEVREVASPPATAGVPLV
ncbi:MAG TPA: TerC/Alx family metal homeostasis membrane protein, partial [Phycisphaerae bacterium]